MMEKEVRVEVIQFKKASPLHLSKKGLDCTKSVFLSINSSSILVMQKQNFREVNAARLCKCRGHVVVPSSPIQSNSNQSIPIIIKQSIAKSRL